MTNSLTNWLRLGWLTLRDRVQMGRNWQSVDQLLLRIRMGVK